MKINPILSRLYAFRVRGIKIICFLLALAFSPPGLFPQETESSGTDSQTGAAASQSETADSTAANTASSASTDNTQTVERGSTSETLRRPERGESPRYPQDIVIGELGKGKAPDGAYSFAMDLIQALTAASKDSPAVAESRSVLTDSLFDQIAGIEPRSYRIGGGRLEDDGNVSFLVRFLGDEWSITGELFLHQAGTPAAVGTPAPAETPAAAGTPAPAESAAGPEDSQVSNSQGAANPPAVSPTANPPTEDKWVLDDLVLEDKVDLTKIKDSYRYDFSPYERLY